MLSHVPPPLVIAQPVSPRFLGSAAPLPPPPIDPFYTSYDGIPGVVESLVVLSILGAAAYLGITTGLQKKDATQKAIGWTAGIGSALLTLLYLGGKSGLGDQVGLPAVRVTPS
jgi:hypothetical protein